MCFGTPFIVGVFYTPPFTGVFLHTSFIWRVSTPLSHCVFEVIENSECGLTQLKSKCSSKIIASILTKTDKDTLSLNIFDDIIEELYTLYKEQDGDIDKLFTELTDDDVTEIL